MTNKFVKTGKLDRINLRILRELQENGRITNLALSERVGVSPPPCLRRVDALEREGYIRGYHAEIDGDKLGFTITAFELVSLTNNSRNSRLDFAELIKTWPEVRECYMATGDIDLLLKIVVSDWNAFQQFRDDKLTALPNVNQSKTVAVTECIKYEHGVPIDDSHELATRPDAEVRTTPPRGWNGQT